jgi:polysaccharide deacetylase 2 family uncharacterized protein YibQ
MGDFGGAAKRGGVRGVSTAFWSIVLLGSTVSIAAGFAGGRSIGAAGSLPPSTRTEAIASLPEPIRQRLFTRQLFGAHSLDAAEAADPYGDPSLAVADYPRARGDFDPRRDRAKIAVVVVDAGRAGDGLGPFVSSPLPVNLVVSPTDDGARATCASIRKAGKFVVVDASSAAPRQVAALVRDGAPAVIASLGEARARALMRALDRSTIVVDAELAEDDVVSSAAKQTTHPALVRDVIADARDDAPYVDFMLRDALALAERNGSAIVVIHARTQSFDALARFADQAQRDGADFVSLADLTS